MRKCLEAEELFAQMMDEDCELNPSTNHDPLEFCSGFIKCEVEHISIDDGCQTESIAVKEELPDVCETQDDIIEPKEEYLSDDLEPENLDNTGLGIEDMLPHISDSDSESDVPLTKFKIEVEEHDVEKLIAEETNNLEPENLDNTGLGIEDMLPHISDSDSESDVPLTKFKIEVEEHDVEKLIAEETNNLEPENLDNTGLGIEDMLPHISDSDSESDVPLTKFKIEVEEHDVEKLIAEETNRTTVTKKAKLDTRRSEQEDTITAELEKNEQSNLKLMETTQNRTSRSDTYVKKPDQRSLYQVEDFRQNTSKDIYEKKYKFDSQQNLGKHKHLTEHIGINAGERPFKCDVCQRSFIRKQYLIQHIRVHTSEKHYKCDLCQCSFTQNGSLKRHMLKHTGDKPFKCDVCQRRFTRNNDLRRHIIRIHTGEKPYKCDVCPRSCFKRNDDLRKHVLIHTGKTPFKCNVCPHSFSDTSNLKTHIRIHTGEKPFKCDICQRSFRRSDHLRNHVRTHTSEKPYKCNVCQQSFMQIGHLKLHMRKHIGEKPYKCDVCRRNFATNSELRNHFRTHTGETPFKCNLCQRSFTRNGDLKRHILIHTGGKSYKCDICQRRLDR